MLPGIILALPALGAAFSMLLGPVGAVALAATAVGVALNKLIENYKTKQDAEIDAIINASTAHANYHAIRKKMINDEIVTIDEWRDIFNKHGRSYKRVLKAISTLPEYAYIRDHLDAITKKQQEVEISVKKLGATATKVFPSWATMVGISRHLCASR
ncbi:hypothetical protein ES703_72670 [subsurface metagenome]